MTDDHIHEVTPMFSPNTLPDGWRVFAEWTGGEIYYRVCQADERHIGSVMSSSGPGRGGVRFIDSDKRWRTASSVPAAVAHVVADAKG